MGPSADTLECGANRLITLQNKLLLDAEEHLRRGPELF
jgi:hypothetical protein